MATVIGSYNIHFKLKVDHIETDMTKLLKSRVSVLGIQEFGKDRRVSRLERICKDNCWALFRPDSVKQQGRNPIMWNDLIWELMDAGSHRANAETMAEFGAGGAFIDSRWATWIILRRRSDQKKIAVINWHAPASVENPLLIKRRAVLKEGTASVTRLAQELMPKVDATFLVGDMNTNYRRKKMRNQDGFPIKTFREIGLNANWMGDVPKMGTHSPGGLLGFLDNGTRLIDFVFSDLKPYKSKILMNYSSDHRPILAFYRF